MPDVNGRIGRVVQRMAGSEPFLRVAPFVIAPLDRAIHRLSGGRFVLSAALLPSVVLTTTGAKTGQPRRVPLATLPEKDGSFLVVGSNFGQDSHPVWTGNLIKTPEATASYRGREIPVTAHLLSDEEKAEAWPRLTAMWPNYDKYVARSGGRNLRVFRLVPR